MRQLTPKEQEIVELAKRGGNDASLLVLQKVQALEDEIASLKQELSKNPPEDVRIEKVALRLAAKISAKGEDGHTPTKEELLALIKPLIPQIKDGATPTKEELLALIRPLIVIPKDGLTPTDEQLLSLIEPLIPALPELEPIFAQMEISVLNSVEKKLPELGYAIRDSLELLQDEERLDVTAIKGLKEAIDVIDKKASRHVGGVVRMNSLSDLIITPTGTVDDSNTVFTFSWGKPQMVNVNGAFYVEGHGWSFTSGSVVLDAPVGVDGHIFGVK
jgi:hypothetical protein